MKPTIPLPPIGYLRRRLKMTTEGCLVWCERPISDFTEECYALMWHKRFAGKKAGSDKGRGYEMVRIDGVAYLSHRIAYAIAHGVDPGGLLIDHRNGRRACNHGANLRAATNAENIQHRTRINTNNKSGVIGVYWSKAARKWCARIRVFGKEIYLGLYTDLAEARRVRQRAEQEHFGAFAPSI